MKNIGLAIFVILLFVGCESNDRFKNSLDKPQISQSDIEYFQNFHSDLMIICFCSSSRYISGSIYPIKFEA